MTAAELLGWIAGALTLQLLAGIGVSVRRRRIALAAVPATVASASAVRADAAWTGWREFRVIRREFEDAAQSQCSFYLQAVDGQALPPFKPGQYLTFNLDIGPRDADATATQRTITRCYSLSDAPDPAHYRVTIKRVPAPIDHPEFEPGLSSAYFHDHVQPGNTLRVKAPAGQFFIDPDHSVPVVLIGGGIGITPMMSMLRWCIAQQPQRPVHLYYGLRNGTDHAFKRVLQETAASHPQLRLNVVYSQPGPSDIAGSDYQHTGHVDVDLLRRTLPQGRHAFYVCGPPAMMRTLVPQLQAWGVPASDIRYEAFGPASVQAPGEAKPATTDSAEPAVDVQFQRSGRTLSWNGQDANLLDFAERHGITVDSGCRSGGCGSCETRLLQGEVRYAHAPDHDVTPGHCLLCVGRPASALVLQA
jgi:uncharacterized protein